MKSMLESARTRDTAKNAEILRPGLKKQRKVKREMGNRVKIYRLEKIENKIPQERTIAKTSISQFGRITFWY